MIYDRQPSEDRPSIKNGSLREFAELLFVGAAALRNLVGSNTGISPPIEDSVEKVLEIASILDSIGKTLRAQSTF